MTLGKIHFDRTITLGAVLSVGLWLGGGIWVVASTNAEFLQVKTELTRHELRLSRVEFGGSEVARMDRQRIEVLERRQIDDAKLLKEVSDLLARIDENVKALKEARRP